MTQELKELLKQINGKEVVWTDEPDGDFVGANIRCVVLALPDKGRVSIKPIDEPKIVWAALEKACKEKILLSLSDISSPSFCCLTIPAHDMFINAFRGISKLQDGEEFSLFKVSGRANSWCPGNPVCPY